MAYTVYIKGSAEKELDLLPKKIHTKITNYLLSLTDNPRPSGVKKLFSREEYRIRIGIYRILYLINENEKKIEIVAVGHRKEVYRLK